MLWELHWWFCSALRSLSDQKEIFWANESSCSLSTSHPGYPQSLSGPSHVPVSFSSHSTVTVPGLMRAGHSSFRGCCCHSSVGWRTDCRMKLTFPDRNKYNTQTTQCSWVQKKEIPWTSLQFRLYLRLLWSSVTHQCQLTHGLFIAEAGGCAIHGT